MLRKLFLTSLTLSVAGIFLSCASTPNDPSLGGDLEVARQFNETGQYRKAVAALQDIRRKNQQNPTVEAYLGYAFMGLNDYSAASAAYEKSLALEPKNQDVRFNYAYALIIQKRYNDARKHLKKIEDDANYPYMEKVHANVGLSYLEEKHCNLAHQKFEEALRLDPTLTSAHYNNGKCYMIEKKYSQAITSFNQAVDSCQGCIDPYLDLTRAYFKNGQGKIAREKLNTILINKPDALTEARVKQILQENKK